GGAPHPPNPRDDPPREPCARRFDRRRGGRLREKPEEHVLRHVLGIVDVRGEAQGGAEDGAVVLAGGRSIRATARARQSTKERILHGITLVRGRTRGERRSRTWNPRRAREPRRGLFDPCREASHAPRSFHAME